MSQAEDDPAFGLMAVAEEYKAAVEAALARLEAHEEALKRERQALSMALTTLREEGVALREDGAAVRRAAEEVGPSLEASVAKAVRSAVTGSLAHAGQYAADTLTAAVRPSLDRLEVATASAQAVAPALRGAIDWLTWRLVARLGAIAIGLVVVMVATRAGLEWWTDHSLASTRAEEAVLQAEIVGLRNTRDTLKEAGDKAGLTKCGPSRRLCIRVDEGAGSFGSQADYRVIRGY